MHQHKKCLMGPAICLSGSAHASDWWMVWVAHEMLSEGMKVVAFPDTSHTFCRMVTNTLTSYTWSSLFRVYLRRTSWSKRGERECMSGSPVISDLCPGLGCCRCHCQAHRSTSCAANLICCSLLVRQHVWSSSVDWFLLLVPYCVHVRQGRPVLGTPK